MIVFGLVAFDNAVAVYQTFPNTVSSLSPIPSPLVLLKALLMPTKSYDVHRIDALQEAVDRLRQKSRSFYLASSVFTGPLRIDLIYL